MSSDEKPVTTLGVSRWFLLLQLRTWFLLVLFLSFFFLPIWFSVVWLGWMLVYDVICRSIFVKLWEKVWK